MADPGELKPWPGARTSSLASPFPPIADYGFLSDCHTGALVASDGSIEWMCLPHFDSPSVFAAMLDRGAGSWRVGPYGLYVPAGRRYVPGTNIIETTWMTPQGWVRVIDGLTIGEWHDNKEGSSHTRPPTDYDADHLLVRVIECIQGMVQVEVVCEPMLDYGATMATWSMVDATGEEGVCRMDAIGTRDEPAASRREEGGRPDGVAFRLFSDIRMGIEGNRAHGRHTMMEGERRFCAISWTEALGGPDSADEALERIERTSHFWREWLAEGVLSGPSVALSPAALGADAEGPDVHADRRAGRRADHLAAGDAAGRAQLGLPLLLDARRVVHALGAARARASTGRPTTSSSTSPTWSATRTARFRSCTASRARRTSRSRRSSTSRATRGRARCGSATAPTRSARTTSTARCSTRSISTPRTATTSPSGCGRCSRPGRMRREGLV